MAKSVHALPKNYTSRVNRHWARRILNLAATGGELPNGVDASHLALNPGTISGQRALPNRVGR